MRLKSIKISGFKPISFCATYNEEKQTVVWHKDAFKILLPNEKPMISAIIGPNSSGKSSVFQALDYFFSPTSKFKPDIFNKNTVDQPIIVELTFYGNIANLTEWYRKNCYINQINLCELSVISIWTTNSRTDYIRLPNTSDLDVLYKTKPADKAEMESLFPRYFLVPAIANLSEEGNPEKKNLLAEIIDEFLENSRSSSHRSITKKIDKKLAELNSLLQRNQSNLSDWKGVQTIEELLTESISPLTPSHPQARLTFNNSVPTLSQIFQKSRVRIEDDIELDLSNHGSGLQRTFVISVLNVWSELIGKKNDSTDYLIAVEEPELYLHPHATRVCLEIFKKIAQTDQLAFTTHSSEFVNQVDLVNITRIQRFKDIRKAKQADLTGIPKKDVVKIQRYLIENRSDMLFARSVLLVEGQSELYAIPSFAQKLGIDLDKYGISIVSTEGKENFEVYCQILNAFQIPHVILGDGDGNPIETKRKYEKWGSPVYVLDYDFEQLVADSITDNRLLEIINECISQKGGTKQKKLDIAPYTAQNLAASWAKKVKEDVYAKIPQEYRNHYQTSQKQLEEIIKQLAKSVVDKGHMLPSATDKRKSDLLKKQGKPLLGRVLGSMLSEQEIKKLNEVVSAIEKVVDIAKS